MKKLGYAASAITALFIGSASAADYEFTPLVGAVWPEYDLGIQSGQIAYGAEFQFNNLFDAVKPELMILVSPDTDYKHSTVQTTISRFMLNGVHEFSKFNSVVPFIKGGLGYENMTEKLYGNEDSIMADAGGGAKLYLMDNFALKFEALYMLKYNSDRWDNNLAGLAGLTFAFGGSEPVAAAVVSSDDDGDGVVNADDACPDTPAGVAVDAQGCTLDSDHDGVINAKDKCPDTPAGEAVDADGCLLDSDHDGVPNMSDKCPNTPEGATVDELGCQVDSDEDGVVDLSDNCPDTPKGFKVDKVGCPIIKTFKLNFVTGSSVIAADSAPKVAEYAEYLKESPAIKVDIIGHTDNVGSNAYNMALSKARAQSVKAMLVKNGISADRIDTEGKGETQPVASNATAEGRAKNRRIEVWLLK